MKIAVHSHGSMIAGHFEERPELVVFEIERGVIRHSVRKCGSVPGLAAACDTLVQLDADLLICGGLSAEAERALTDAGIPVLKDRSGEARTVVEQYLEGALDL